METVILKPLHHNSAEMIGIYSPQKGLLNHIFKKKPVLNGAVLTGAGIYPAQKKVMKSLPAH